MVGCGGYFHPVSGEAEPLWNPYPGVLGKGSQAYKNMLKPHSSFDWSGVIKLPILGQKTMQFNGDFEGFPL